MSAINATPAYRPGDRGSARTLIEIELNRIKAEVTAMTELTGNPIRDRYLRQYASFAANTEAERRALSDLAATDVQGDESAWLRHRQAHHLAALTVNTDGVVVDRKHESAEE